MASVTPIPTIPASNVAITITYPGAAADTIESLITTPIETELASLAHLSLSSSTATFGQATINLQFELGYDVNLAIPAINSRINALKSTLPKAIQSIQVEAKDPNANPTMYIGIQHPSWSHAQMIRYILDHLQPRLRQATDMGEPKLLDSATQAIRQYVNPIALQAHHMSASHLAQASALNNDYPATGALIGDQTRTTVQVKGQPHRRDAFAHDGTRWASSVKGASLFKLK